MFFDFYEMMDQAVCQFYKINIDQLNYLSDRATTEELEEFIHAATQEDLIDEFDENDDIFNLSKETRVKVFGRIRRGIELRDKYLKSNGVWIQM